MDENPFLTRKYLAAEILQHGWTVGDHTYGNPTVMEHQYGTLEIGRFCSIASNVAMILGNHRMDMVSTYPFRSFFGFWPGSEHGAEDHDRRGGITIGSDVWISNGVTILAGSRIGHGAVLGADAVVSGSVEPYAIMVGNPARQIRTRFSPDVVRQLLEIAWWDWPDERVRQEIEVITSGDVQAFLKRFAVRPS